MALACREKHQALLALIDHQKSSSAEGKTTDITTSTYQSRKTGENATYLGWQAGGIVDQ